MSLLKPFKLDKLLIVACCDPEREKPIIPSLQFEAMFNPSTLTQTYALAWTRQNTRGGTPSLDYTRTPPQDISLTLILDGTGVDQHGFERFTQQTVLQRIQKFLQVTYYYQGDLHEPAYLLISWAGTRWLECRLQSVDIKYTLFDRDGTPLRAELSAKFVSDPPPVKTALKKNPKSADLTHMRMVSSGDTLPLLTKQVYGSADRYLDVARFNNLDDFRNLTPGQRLLFPPLATLGLGR